MSQTNIITKTHVNLVKERKEGSDLLGFANITLGNNFMEVKGFRIRKNQNGIFVSPPSKAKTKDGKVEKWTDPETGEEKDSYEQVARTLCDDAKNILHAAVLNAYSAKVAEAKANGAEQ